ncbi:hypothetical protein OGM63_09300 [Plectonema radiosum NIES-515]|jgi:hypothetical protein|uniref:Uncharacterized protein n=1 Tax=Plectonema radiosum NIES-515 TaxID=2986073 RepID=A0ABT3AYB9_9CYAN|nr:hypothetical protein [Plectonema radiosum]MCV3213705.1 hypothetical protein [Plectonema radiosum NIES-515]
MGVINSTAIAIHPKTQERTMLQKLLQAAIITFLLHLLAGLSQNSSIHPKTESSLNTKPVPMVSWVFRSAP